MCSANLEVIPVIFLTAWVLVRGLAIVGVVLLAVSSTP